MSNGGGVFGGTPCDKLFSFLIPKIREHLVSCALFQWKQKTRKAQWGLAKLSFVLSGWKTKWADCGKGGGVGQGPCKGNKLVEGRPEWILGEKKRQRAKYMLMGRPWSPLHAALLHVCLLSLAVSSKGPQDPRDTAQPVLSWPKNAKGASGTTTFHSSSEPPAQSLSCPYSTSCSHQE